MRFAAIALLLTSTNAAASKDMKAVLAKMSPKDLEAMAKHFEQAAQTKTLQAQGPDVSDELMHAWDQFIAEQEHLDAELHKEQMAALDKAPVAIQHAYDELAGGLDQAHAGVKEALSPESIAHTKEAVDHANKDLHDHLAQGVSEGHDFLNKFHAGYEAGYKKALENWKNDKPLLREQVQGLADAAETAHADGAALADKLAGSPEAQSLEKSYHKLMENLGQTLDFMEKLDKENLDIMREALAKQFHDPIFDGDFNDFEDEVVHDFEDEFNLTGLAKKKAPATISMVNLGKAPKVQPEASYFGWGSMTLLVAALASSAYTYNKVQKKQTSANDDMFSKVSENLMSA